MINRKTIKQFIIFGIVGVLNTGVDYTVFNVLLHFFRFDVIPCNVLAYISGMVTSFFLNKYWTFGNKENGYRQLSGFIIINLISLGVSTVLLQYIYIGRFELSESFAKLLTYPFTIFINFTGNKLFVFKEKV